MKYFINDTGTKQRTSSEIWKKNLNIWYDNLWYIGLCVSHNLFSRILPRTDYKTAYPKEWRIKVLHCYQKPKYSLIYSHPKFQTSFETIKPFAVESSFFYTKPSSNIKWGCTHHSSFAIFLFFEIESQSTQSHIKSSYDAYKIHH